LQAVGSIPRSPAYSIGRFPGAAAIASYVGRAVGPSASSFARISASASVRRLLLLLLLDDPEFLGFRSSRGCGRRKDRRPLRAIAWPARRDEIPEIPDRTAGRDRDDVIDLGRSRVAGLSRF
jgi:hypothetical protein